MNMQPLTRADRASFIEHGYLLVPDVVPREYCERVIAAICDFVAVDPDDVATWRRYARTGSGRHAIADVALRGSAPHQDRDNGPVTDPGRISGRGHGQGHGIVPLHHHQALWDVRQLPQVHALFSMLLDTPKLWVSLDRVSFKVPESMRDEPFRMDAVHWDGNPRGHELALQGLIYLTDNPAGQGAFGMVPQLYRQLDAWLADPNSDPDLRKRDVSAFPLVPLAGQQGSMVLWHRRMPHTSLANSTARPRYVQYVTMSPAGDESARQEFAALTLEKHPPAWALRQKVTGQRDPEPGPPLQLSALGRKLAGIDAW